jgi:hypothetical protein
MIGTRSDFIKPPPILDKALAIFALVSPSASNKDSSILPAMASGSVFAVIPALANSARNCSFCSSVKASTVASNLSSTAFSTLSEVA